jgi:apolipoprotein N-acyltransferase
LAFVALVPFLLRLGSVRGWRALGIGWIVGTVGCTTLVAASIYAACRSYFGLSPWLSAVVAVVIPQVYGVPYFVLFGGLAARLLRRDRPALTTWIGVPAAWVACELARAHVGHGAPWIMLGHSQHAWLSLIQCADITGVYGVSFLVALVNIAIARGAAAWLENRPPAPLLGGVALVIALIGSALLYGRVQMTHWSDPPEPPLQVALVQGSTPDNWRYSLRYLPQTLQRYRDLTERITAAAPDLVIWPENAISVLVSANPDVLRQAAASLPANSHLLLGAPRAASAAGGALRNAAFLIDHDGTVLGVQDKLRLTPFAEYAPSLAPAFLDPPVIGSGHYSAGDERTLFAVGAARFAVLICYEAIYPDLTRERVLDGAQFLVNISNDDWFLQRPAIQQHFIAAQFRAIETRRYLLRATSSGITAIVDPRGAVVAEAPIGEPATISSTVHPLTVLTFHARHGDVFAWLCALFASWLMVPPLRLRT